MEDFAKLEDITTFGTWSDVRKAVETLRRSTVVVCEWIPKNIPRTEDNLMLHKLLIATLPYLDVAIRELGGPTQVLAFCTRSIYELNLRTRHLIDSADGMQRWKEESVRDNIEALEGLLTLRNESSESHAAVLEQEISRLRALADKYQIRSDARPLSAAELARAVGRLDEHKAFFKLYSKLVHPSAYSVNMDRQEVQRDEIRNILLIQLQLYGWDLVNRIATKMDVPESIVAPAIEPA